MCPPSTRSGVEGLAEGPPLSPARSGCLSVFQAKSLGSSEWVTTTAGFWTISRILLTSPGWRMALVVCREEPRAAAEAEEPPMAVRPSAEAATASAAATRARKTVISATRSLLGSDPSVWMD